MRHLSFLQKSISRPRVTLRTNGGCLIKYDPTKLSSKQFEMLSKLGQQVIEQVPESIDLTLRGEPRWSEEAQSYSVWMKDNQRKVHSVLVQKL